MNPTWPCGGVIGGFALLVDRVQAAEQNGFGIGGRHETVCRGRQLGFLSRGDEIGGHHHYQFGFVVLKIATAKQRAQNRHILEAGKRVELLFGGVLHQAGDGEAAARWQFDRGFCPAHRERGNGLRLNCDRIAVRIRRRAAAGSYRRRYCSVR